VATFLWETTGGGEALDRTSDVTVAPDGNIWVADGGHSQFQIFAPDGTYLESWGGAGVGSDDGQFNFLRPNSEGDSFGAVAFAPDGSFYVADMGNLRIQHFSADRAFLHAWGGFGGEDGQFLSPIDIAVDSQGNVFVDDDKRADVQKFAPDGTWLLTFGGTGREPGQLDFQAFMTVDQDDTIWVADPSNQRIQQWANDGQFLQAIDTTGMIDEPFSIAFDTAGRMFVADLSGIRVVVFDATGAVVGEWGRPAGVDVQVFSNIALDGDGNAYVLSYPDGTLLGFQLQPPVSGVTTVATPVA
jgi:tripartite motif-containing protein 71